MAAPLGKISNWRDSTRIPEKFKWVALERAKKDTHPPEKLRMHCGKPPQCYPQINLCNLWIKDLNLALLVLPVPSPPSLS